MRGGCAAFGFASFACVIIPAGKRGHPVKEKITDGIADDVLRGATAFQQLCWLAAGRIDSAALTASYRAAIDRDNPRLNAYADLDAGANAAAAASAARRREGRVIGRLDGL